MEQYQAQGRGRSNSRLLFGAVTVCIIIAVFLEVIVQVLPPHYNPLSQSESDLAVGPYGFLMDINFIIRGLLYLIFLAAFTRVIPEQAQSRSGVILLAVAAIGKFVIAFAATDLTARPETLHGTIHAVAALVSFFCGALGELLLARALRHALHTPLPRHFLVGLATLTLVWSVLIIVTVFVSSQIGIWGLLERIFTSLSFLWVLVVSLRLCNTSALNRRGVQSIFSGSSSEDLETEIFPRSK